MGTIGRRVAVVAISVIVSVSAGAETFGMRKQIPRPDAYGRVVMDSFATKAQVAPVVFDHWNHRNRYTCRLCHVDLGFAMRAGETGVREADNRHGLYCGACHNNKEAFGWEREERQGLTTKPVEACDRCHSVGKAITPEKDFYAVTQAMPKSGYGNHVDWLAAEAKGLIHLQDELPGITRKRKPIRYAGEVVLHAREFNMPEIVFSHTKHAVWNGCEMCHPEIFGLEKGATKYTMQDIFEGRFCGACHDKVSFPMNFDCRLCHTKDVF